MKVFNWPVFLCLTCWMLLAALLGWLFRVDGSDFIQLESDAWYFFETASQHNIEFIPNLLFIITTENLLPLLIYDKIYLLAQMLQLPMSPIYGILVNISIMVWSCYSFIQFGIRFLGVSNKQAVMQANIIGSFGLFMLFGGIHLRDCFAVALLIFSTNLLHPYKIQGKSFFKISLLLLALCLIGYGIRTEMVIIPLIPLISLGIISRSSISYRIIQIILLIFLVSFLGSQFFDILLTQYNAYAEMSETESSADSIAFTLLYEMPLLLSQFFASFLVFFIKFPFWSGFNVGSYHFFFSLSAFQIIFYGPLFVRNAMIILVSNSPMKSSYLYYLYIILGLLIAVAATSMQSRHFFILFPLIVAIIIPAKGALAFTKFRQLFTAGSGLFTIGLITINLLFSVRSLS